MSSPSDQENSSPTVTLIIEGKPVEVDLQLFKSYPGCFFNTMFSPSNKDLLRPDGEGRVELDLSYRIFLTIINRLKTNISLKIAPNNVEQSEWNSELQYLGLYEPFQEEIYQKIEEERTLEQYINQELDVWTTIIDNTNYVSQDYQNSDYHCFIIPENTLSEKYQFKIKDFLRERYGLENKDVFPNKYLIHTNETIIKRIDNKYIIHQIKVLKFDNVKFGTDTWEILRLLTSLQNKLGKEITWKGQKITSLKPDDGLLFIQFSKK